MTTGTQSAFADHLGCSGSYVSRLKRLGRLVFTDDGLVDFEKSKALIAAARDPDHEGGAERWRREKGRPAVGDIAAASRQTDTSDDAPTGAPGHEPAAPEDAVDQPATGASRELYEQRLRAQIRREEHQAATAEIELHLRAGSLIRVSDAKDRQFVYGRLVRDTVLGIGDRMAPHLTPEQRAQLHTELKATLHELERRVAAESRVKREAGATEPA